MGTIGQRATPAVTGPDGRLRSALARTGYWPWALAAGVLVSRILTTGPVYFADGPAEIKAIQGQTFLIQPPGYWLFIRIASLFPHPAFGMSLMNWGFSAAGVVAFYYAARLLVGERMAKWGSALYAVLFYAWFSGDVQSTYASQLLFPVLVFVLLLLHMRERRVGYLLGAAVAFGVGAGFRPSDGAFIGAMFVYYLIRHAPRKQAALAFAIATVVCLVWLVPTAICYESLGGLGRAGRYMGSVATVVSILSNGPTVRAMANMARFMVPLVLAFGPLLYLTVKSLRDVRRPEATLLWLWILPGALFLVLVYMSDAPYLDFLTAPVLLLAMWELQKLGSRRRLVLLGSCIAWNVAFFLIFQPVAIGSLPFATVDVYAGKYTHYGVANRWEPNLSTLRPGATLGFSSSGVRPAAHRAPSSFAH